MIIDRGLIVSFDSTTHTANVQLMGSMSTLIYAVPAAHQIGPELLTPGTHCILGFARESSDGIILATFDGPPDPWITPDLITFSPSTPEGAFHSSNTPQTLSDTFVTYQSLTHEITVSAGKTIRYLCVATAEMDCTYYTNSNNRLLRIYEGATAKGAIMGDESRAVDARHVVTNSFTGTITTTATISAKVRRGQARNTEVCQRGTMSLTWWEDT